MGQLCPYILSSLASIDLKSRDYIPEVNAINERRGNRMYAKGINRGITYNQVIKVLMGKKKKTEVNLSKIVFSISLYLSGAIQLFLFFPP